MHQQYSKPFQISLPHDTCYLQFDQPFQKSIGYSQKIPLENPSLLKHEEYLKDMLIYNAIHNSAGISSAIPEEIECSNNSSCNQFMHVSEDNKPKFSPSKWEKPNKTQTCFNKKPAVMEGNAKVGQSYNEVTFGKPAKNEANNPFFPGLKILENHSGEIEESVTNESTATTKSTSIDMDNVREEEEWNKAKHVIKDLKKLIG